NLYALSLADGKPRWTYAAKPVAPPASTTSKPASRKAADDEPNAIHSSPCVYDATVFFGDEGGTFHAVDAATGRGRWTFATEDQIVSSANISGDNVLFASYDANLYCLNRRSGTLLWKHETAGR